MNLYRIRLKLSDKAVSEESKAELSTVPTLVSAKSLANALAVVTALNLVHYNVISVDLLPNEKLVVAS